MTSATPSVVVYGKVIVDEIVRSDGMLVRGVLGGGGPQALFGSRLWNDSVGFMSRAGDDLEARYLTQLQELDASLDGLKLYPEVATLRSSNLTYDPTQAYVADPTVARRVLDAMGSMNAKPLEVPAAYRSAAYFHLIVRRPDDSVFRQVTELRGAGTTVSVEPLWEPTTDTGSDDVLELASNADVVTPDLATAKHFSSETEIERVLAFWSRLGPSVVAVRAGLAGSYLWSRETGDIVHIPICKVHTVDPTGAGNAFGGALVGALANGLAPLEAAIRATVAGSLTVEVAGMPALTDDLRAEAERRVKTLNHLVGLESQSTPRLEPA